MEFKCAKASHRLVSYKGNSLSIESEGDRSKCPLMRTDEALNSALRKEFGGHQWLRCAQASGITVKYTELTSISQAQLLKASGKKTSKTLNCSTLFLEVFF